LKKQKRRRTKPLEILAFLLLVRNRETDTLLKICARSLWLDDGTPSELVFNRLKLIPKKGDLHDLNDWRGIVLMKKKGFMPHSGCRDGIFSL
jgi:hypothetical protein